MNHAFFLGAALLLAVPTLAQQRDKAQDPAATAKKIQGYVPGSTVDGTLVLKDLKGKEKKLSDFAGKVTVVDFWSITCPISKGWEERLKTIAAEYGKKDVNFVAINPNHTEHGKVAKITEYVDQLKLPYTVLVDENNVVADKFGATHTPHIFVLDTKGVVKYVGAIDDDQSGRSVKKQYLRDALDSVIAGKEPTETKTEAKGCTIKRVDASAKEASHKGEKPAKEEKKEEKK